MNKYLLIVIGILVLALAFTGMALKKQLQVNGERLQAIKEAKAALDQALELKNASEAVVEARDKELTQIKFQSRKYKHELIQALANNDCAKQPIPVELDRLLHERFPKTSENLPTKNNISDVFTPLLGR